MEERRMTKQKQRRSSPSEKYILLGLILGGIVLFVLTLGLSFRHQKKAIEREVSSTLNLAKTTCQKYLDYEMGITTKDLQVRSFTFTLPTPSISNLTSFSFSAPSQLKEPTPVNSTSFRSDALR